MENKKYVKVVVWITVLTLLSRLIGFLREVLFANYYGASIESDAFLLAWTVAGIVTSVLFMALRNSYIPIYSELAFQSDKDKLRSFVNSSYTTILLLILVFSTISFIFSDTVIYIFAPKLDLEARALASTILRIVQFTVVANGIVELNNARLQVHNSYFVPLIMGFVSNFTIIFYMLFFNDGVIKLSWFIVIAAILQIVIQLPYLFKHKLGFKISFKLNNESLLKLGKIVVPIIIGTAVYEVNVMVDKILASGLPIGSISALTYSNKIVLLVTSILSASIGTIFFSSMSKLFLQSSLDKFSSLLMKTLRITLIVAIPSTIIFIFYRYEIIKIVFERGFFDEAATQITAIAFGFYSIALFAFALKEVLNKAFYSMKDTKTVMYNGIIGVVINIILNIILTPIMGIAGLALATSIATIITAVLLMISVNRKIHKIINVKLILFICKIFIFSGISFAGSYLLKISFIDSFNLNIIIEFIIIMLFFFAIYGMLLLLFEAKEIKDFKNSFTKK
jgi:putative peptidoglycan lipid II flippase